MVESGMNSQVARTRWQARVGLTFSQLWRGGRGCNFCLTVSRFRKSGQTVQEIIMASIRCLSRLARGLRDKIVIVG